MAEENGVLKALRIIQEQLPKFLSETNVPFSKSEPQSVMRAPDKGLQEKTALETLLKLAAGAVPASKAAVAAAKIPGVIPAAITAATGDPTNLIPGKLGMVSGGVEDAEAAITRGGTEHLFATHSTQVDRLLKFLRRSGDRIPALDNPSYAITRGSPEIGHFGDTTLVLLPDAPIDPASSTVQLFNRDAYTSRGKERKTAEFISQDLRGTEGATSSLSQMLAILASPRFSSLDDYIKSPAGAATLGKDIQKIDLPEKLLKGYKSAEDQVGYARDLIRQFALEGNPVLGKLMTQGSEYAEGKLVGKLPITKSNVAAIITPTANTADEVNEALSMLPGRLPIAGTIQDFMPASLKLLNQGEATKISKAAEKAWSEMAPSEQAEFARGDYGVQALFRDLTRFNFADLGVLPSTERVFNSVSDEFMWELLGDPKAVRTYIDNTPDTVNAVLRHLTER